MPAEVPGTPPPPEGTPERATGSVTVAVTRVADPDRTAEMLAWVRSGAALAESFEGFLGAGWLRPAGGLREWHMLYRFADPAALRRWEGSPQRAWWLSTARGIVEDTRVERRTGVEGWFESPAAATVEVPPRVPPRAKQMVVIWLGFFPLSLLANAVLGPLLAGQHVALRTLVTTLCLIPVMTYLVLPRLTRALEWWLHGRPAPWRGPTRRSERLDPAERTRR